MKLFACYAIFALFVSSCFMSHRHEEFKYLSLFSAGILLGFLGNEMFSTDSTKTRREMPKGPPLALRPKN